MRRRAGVGVLAGVLLAGLVAVPGAPAGAQLDDYPPDWQCEFQQYALQGSPSGMWSTMFISADVPGPVAPGEEVTVTDVLVVIGDIFLAGGGTYGELEVLGQEWILPEESNHLADGPGPFGPVYWEVDELTLIAPEEPGEHDLFPEFIFYQDLFGATGRDFDCDEPFGVLVVEEEPNGDNGNGENGEDPGGNGEDPDGNGQDPEGDEDPTVRTEVRRIQQPAPTGAAPRFTG